MTHDLQTNIRGQSGAMQHAHIFGVVHGHKMVKPKFPQSSLGWIENYPILLKIASKLDDYLGIKHGLLENSPFNYS
jgi:hypothetical protein